MPQKTVKLNSNKDLEFKLNSIIKQKLNEAEVSDIFKQHEKEIILETLRKVLNKPELTQKNINTLPIFNGECLMDLAINTKNNSLLSFLCHFDIDFDSLNFEGEKVLEKIAKNCDEKVFTKVLGENFDDEIKNSQSQCEKLKALKTLNKKSQNLLMIAVENGNIKAVNFLLNLKIFDVNFEVEKVSAASKAVNFLLNLKIFDVNFEVEKVSAASIAWEKQFYEIFFQLLLHNANYPQNFSENFLIKANGEIWIDKIYVFLSEINKLHSMIDEEEILKSVKSLLEIYPNLKYFQNSQNKSLILKLSENRQFELCDELQNLNLELCKHEKFEDAILKDEKIVFKVEIKAQPKSDEKQNPLNYEINFMKILETNAHFIASEEHPKVTKPTYFKIIQQILKVLASVPLNVNFMKLLAAYNHKKVIYDFSNTRQKPCVDNKKYLNRNEVIFCCEDFLKFPINILVGEVSHEEATTVKKPSNKLFSAISKPPNPNIFGYNVFGPGSSYRDESSEVPPENIPPKHQLDSCYGSVTHELCHWALQLTYENHCKPFAVEDNMRKEIYSEVLKKTVFSPKFVKELEKPDEKFYQAEVPARIHEILTFFRDDPRMIEKIKKDFRELFLFYENYVLPDIKKASRIIFGVKKVDEINAQLGVEEIFQAGNFRIKNEFLNIDLKSAVSNVTVITSNCPILVLTSLYQIHYVNEENRKFRNTTLTKVLQGKSENESKYLIFAEQTQIFIKDYREPIVDAFKACDDSILVIYCKNNLKLLVLADIMQKLQTFKRVICITNEVEELPKNFVNVSVNFEWASLTDDTKEKILQKEINFQGENLKVQDIFQNDDCESFMEHFVNEKEIKIGRKLPEIKFFIERKFIQDSINEELEVKELLKTTKDEKIIFLKGEVGSGKSTALLHLAQVFKNQNQSKMICFIDVGEVFDEFVYRKMEEIFEVFEGKNLRKSDKNQSDSRKSDDNRKVTFLRFLAKYVLNLNSLERKVFNFMVEKGDVILLFDAFDEISSKFDKVIIDFILNLDLFVKNQIWIATRENYDLSFRVFQLATLTNFQKQEFILSLNPAKSYEGQIQNNFDKIQGLGEFSKLILLCEIKSENSNLFEVFELYFDSKLKKGKNQNDIEYLMESFEILAVEKVFGEKTFSLSSFDYDKITNFSEIVKVERKIYFKFVQRCLPEFLVARFILKKIKSEEFQPKIDNILLEVLENSKFEFIRKIVDKKIYDVESEKKKSKSNSENISVEFTKYFLNAILQSSTSSKVLKNLIPGCPNLLKFVTNLTKKDSIAVYKMWIEDNDHKSVFLDLIAQENFELLWQCVENFKDKVLKQILSDNERNIFISIAKQNLKFDEEETRKSDKVSDSEEISKKFKKVVKIFSPDFPEPSTSMEIDPEKSSKLLEIFTKVRSTFTADSIDEYSKMLISKDADGHSNLFYAAKNGMKEFWRFYLEDLERFVEKNLIREVFSGENILNLVEDLETLKILLKFVEDLFDKEEIPLIVNAKIVTTENPIFGSIHHQKCEIFKAFLAFYKNHGLIDFKSQAIYLIFPLINVDFASEIFQVIHVEIFIAMSKHEFNQKVLGPIKVMNNLNPEKKQKLLAICEEFGIPPGRNFNSRSAKNSKRKIT